MLARVGPTLERDQPDQILAASLQKVELVSSVPPFHGDQMGDHRLGLGRQPVSDDHGEFPVFFWVRIAADDANMRQQVQFLPLGNDRGEILFGTSMTDTLSLSCRATQMKLWPRDSLFLSSLLASPVRHDVLIRASRFW